jgi:hypothetical protein
MDGGNGSPGIFATWISLPGRTSQFSPSDQLDVLFPKEFAKSLASKEVEIALSPGGAPSLAFKRGSLHFVISEG